MKTFYKLICLLIIVLFLVNSAQAAMPKPIWQSGQITLWDKQTIEGQITYNWLAEMIMFRQEDGLVRTFSADQVYRFGWFDYSISKYRAFRSLPATDNKYRNQYAFYEVCMDGPMSVVRRLRRPHGLWKRAFGHPSHYTDQPVLAQDTDHFDYFVQDASQLINMNQFYLEIYSPLMTTYDKEIQDYVLRHNINTRSLHGRLVMIDHYNFLVQHDTRTASAREYVKGQE
ncbi:hypothetical protein [Spirosoma koreense]